jgi:aminopeptidase
MLSKAEIADLADKIVNTSLRIGRKDNPESAKAVKKYLWLKGANFTVAEAVEKSGLSEKKVLKLIKSLSLPDRGPVLVKDGEKYHVKEKIGHAVRIIYNAANKELAYEIEKACWAKGATTLAVESSARKAADSFMLAPIGSLSEFQPLKKAILDTIDFSINIDSIEREFWSQGIPPERIKAAASPAERTHDIMDRRHTRWLFMGWPHPESAKEQGIDPKFFEQVMFDSIKASYSKEMVETLREYAAAFTGSGRIQIVKDDGTDLRFSVKGRHFLIDDAVIDAADVRRKDVGMNIPCGEIFTAPREGSANGNLFIPLAFIRDRGPAEKLMLTFKRGEVAEFTAEKGKEHLEKFLAENSGEIRRIAEFGIGCNSSAKYTGGAIIVDEKIAGTIHIAIGWNVGFGGRNRASSHLDFIKPLANGGKVYADGKLLIDDGKLVV